MDELKNQSSLRKNNQSIIFVSSEPSVHKNFQLTVGSNLYEILFEIKSSFLFSSAFVKHIIHYNFFYMEAMSEYYLLGAFTYINLKDK